MPGNRTIERETAWNSVVRFAIKLNETPIGERNIFKENEDQKSCYSKMIVKLNGLGKNLNPFDCDIDKLLGPLLRLLWRKHEKDLRVGNYELDIKKGAYCKYNEATKEWEVHINFKLSMDPNLYPKDEWHAAFETIFHEFSHNIFNVAKIGGIELAKTDIIKRFGKEIETEVNTLLAEENSKDTTQRRLKELTYYKQENKTKEKIQKKYRAAMFDIIGAVLYRGKYGCYPPNSKFYNENNECKERKCVCEIVSITNSGAINCSHRNLALREPNHDIKLDYDYCSKSGECKFKAGENKGYKKNCDLETNDWCNEIYGHGVDYWEPGPEGEWKKTKSNKHKYKEEIIINAEGEETTRYLEFLKLLAEETFVHMAANAITNPNAYGKIAECLPSSELMFIDILKEVLSEELEAWRNVWNATIQECAE